MKNGKNCILIIDDDALIQELLVLALQLNNFEVYMAKDGSTAIELLNDSEIRNVLDIIMVDLMMPVMDGLRFLRWLRKDAKIDIPVLVLTAMNKASTFDEVIAAGATDLVFKPVNVPQLFDKINTILP